MSMYVCHNASYFSNDLKVIRCKTRSTNILIILIAWAVVFYI